MYLLVIIQKSNLKTEKNLTTLEIMIQKTLLIFGAKVNLISTSINRKRIIIIFYKRSYLKLTILEK
jgi:hypothetical protein